MRSTVGGVALTHNVPRWITPSNRRHLAMFEEASGSRMIAIKLTFAREHPAVNKHCPQPVICRRSGYSLLAESQTASTTGCPGERADLMVRAR